MTGGGFALARSSTYPVNVYDACDEGVELLEARGVVSLPVDALGKELAHDHVLEVVVLKHLLRRDDVDPLLRREVLEEGLLGIEALILVQVLDHDPVQVARTAPALRHLGPTRALARQPCPRVL